MVARRRAGAGGREGVRRHARRMQVMPEREMHRGKGSGSDHRREHDDLPAAQSSAEPHPGMSAGMDMGQTWRPASESGVYSSTEPVALAGPMPADMPARDRLPRDRAEPAADGPLRSCPIADAVRVALSRAESDALIESYSHPLGVALALSDPRARDRS